LISDFSALPHQTVTSQVSVVVESRADY
jgi:hypothetical protein